MTLIDYYEKTNSLMFNIQKIRENAFFNGTHDAKRTQRGMRSVRKEACEAYVKRRAKRT